MPRLSLLLLPALVLACTQTPPPAAPPMAVPPAAAPTPMTVVDGFPHGTYTTTIVAADIPASAPEEARGQISGAWVIDFGTNGHAPVTLNGRQVVDATFTVNGNQLVMGTDSGEFACNATARYTWHAAGGELHLTKLEDPCAGRSVVLTAHPLVRR